MPQNTNHTTRASAEALIAEGLRGQPPPELAAELLALRQALERQQRYAQLVDAGKTLAAVVLCAAAALLALAAWMFP